MSTSFALPHAVRNYIQQWGVREHPVLAQCRQETEKMSRAIMQISPEQGAFMQTMVQLTRAGRAIEVGVFTGYSSTAVALTMKELHGSKAQLIACDVSDEYTAKARKYWHDAGVESLIDLHLGPAKDTLTALAKTDPASYDFMFIDADKTGYADYYELGVVLLRTGGLMLIDNMLWSGRVADAHERDSDTEALRALAKRIHADNRVVGTIASVGDGLSVIVKR